MISYISPIYIGLAAASLTYGLTYSLQYSLFNGLATFLFYLKTYLQKKHLYIFFIGLMLLLCLFIYLPFHTKYILIALMPLLFLYNHTQWKIRTIPYLKIFFISFCWSYMTYAFPMESLNDLSLMRFGELYGFFFLLCLIFDHYDLSKDQKEGIRTIPSLLRNKFFIIFYFFLLFTHMILMQYLSQSIVLTCLILFFSSFYFLRPVIFKNKLTLILAFDGITLLRGLWEYFH